MIRRLYVHNFRCLVNFELPLVNVRTGIIVGRNGVGKTSVIGAIELLGLLALGKASFKDRLPESEFSRLAGHDPDSRTPTLRLELEADILEGHSCNYIVAFEWPSTFDQPRILEEGLYVDGAAIITRTRAATTFRVDPNAEATFPLDWHQSAISQIQEPHEQHPLHWFKNWLSNILILRPIPDLMSGVSRQTSRLLRPDCSNFADWYRWILLSDSEAGSGIGASLREIWPEFRAMRSEQIGPDAYDISLDFSDENNASLRVRLDDLSEGEKILVLWACVLAWSRINPHSVCLWDEPDSHVALHETQSFVRSLRRVFEHSGQFIATSHSAAAMRVFSRENTIILRRRSHTLPTLPPKTATELDLSKDDDIEDILSRGEEALTA